MSIKLQAPINATAEVNAEKTAVSLIVRNELGAPIGFYALSFDDAFRLGGWLRETARHLIGLKP